MVLERVIIGGQEDITNSFSFRPYVIIDFNFSMIEGGNLDKKLIDAPFILETRAGIGMEFMMIGNKKNKVGTVSFFIEILGGEQIFTSADTGLDIGTSLVTSVIGARWYF